MKIAFLTSIYPAHADKIYRENPSLKNKSSAEQMEFIRWNAALSTTVNRMTFLKDKGLRICNFNIGLTNINLKWAEENNFVYSSKNTVEEIGIEKIKRFNPDIIFCLSPLIYISNNFIKELKSKLKKRLKFIAWYGANCGDEDIFSKFDLTLSNSKHLVNSLKKKSINSDFLQHCFDLDILKKIVPASTKQNSISFFGNLNIDKDFRDRTKMIVDIKSKIDCFDIYAETQKPNKYLEFKYESIKIRHKASKYLKKIFPEIDLKNWQDETLLPGSPWILEKKFTKSILKPLYGKEMLERLALYQMTFNKHNNHTGDVACNMRMFEATGMGNLLLTDNKSDIAEYFSPDDEVVVYNSTHEAIDKIKQLLDNPNLARSIAKRGQLKCHVLHNSKIVNERFYDIIINY